MRKALVFGVILIAGVVALCLHLPWSKPGFALPALMLWAWERPENLEFIDPHEVGVAYLAGTLELRGGEVIAVPRLQPLRIPPVTEVMAVVRVESRTSPPPRLSPQQREQAVSAIVGMASRPGLTATQIDFDARASERAFYAGLLWDLRQRLPRGQMLSITALASWCLDDDWIAGLPIDEAVPMLFRMGPDDDEVRRRLRDRRDFQDPACRLSAGVSTDEPLPALPYGRRVYIFHPRPWTATAATNIIRQVKSWQ